MDKVELVIIGAGPAGLSAAIYAARADIDTHVLGCMPKFAGEYDIDNYFGFPETISGKELQERGIRQAERFGAALSCERVLSVHPEENGRFIIKSEKRELDACAVILATGVSRVRPGVKNLANYEGKGVSYCVSCDGFFYKDKPVLVLGEANFAANQALELLNFTRKVTVCTQGKASKMDESYLQSLAAAGISVLSGKITAVEGNGGLERAIFEDGSSLDIHGLFVAMGEATSTDFAYTLGVAHNGQFLEADNDQRTNVPGVFAAGDCTGGFLQISVAVGEGAKAGKSAIDYVRKVCRKA